MDTPQLRNFSELKAALFDNEGVPTVTSKEQVIINFSLWFGNLIFCQNHFQEAVERLVEKCYDRFEQLSSLDPSLPFFHKKEHIKYLEHSLRHLSTSYECLDSSRPWLVYWILQAAHLLNFKFSKEVLADVVKFLVKCRWPLGGFGGGPGQHPHLGLFSN
jgi:protein farnesyltransferase subunit beta